MASLKDRLSGIFSNNNYEMQPLQQNADLPLVQLKADGTGTVQPYTSDMDEKPVTLGQKLGYTFLGVPEKQVLATDDNGNEVYQQIGRRGGILNDLAQGYRDNYDNRFSVSNLTPDKDKNWATRIGEGLGTVGRFIDSPASRGLITAGLIGAVGGNPAQMLSYGLTGAVGRQNYITADKLYRNQLENQGIDTSNIRGNITDKMFQNYSLANYRNKNLDVKLQLGMLKDNTSRAKFIGNLLQNNMITPIEAMQRMAEYGINISDLDTSNQTKLLPFKQQFYGDASARGWKSLGLREREIENREKILSDKEKQEEEQANDLAEFEQIYNGRDRNKTEYARQAYIRKHGKDPMKYLELY